MDFEQHYSLCVASYWKREANLHHCINTLSVQNRLHFIDDIFEHSLLNKQASIFI